MATFQYEAMNQAGQEVKDEIDAQSVEDALAKIRSQGYYPTKLRQKGGKRAAKAGQAAAGGGGGGAAPKKKRSVAGFGRVKVKDVTQFTRQLSTLQDAGLPILRCIRVLEQQQKKGSMLRSILGYVADDVEGGATLSEAMAGQPKAFDRLYCNMVAAGEAGGVLDVILQRLADFMEKAQRLKRKVVGAMIYPLAVISFSVAIVSAIMIVVIPKFKQIFEDFGTTLPTPTVLLINASAWFTTGALPSGAQGPPGWAVVLISPVVLVLFLKLVKQSESGRFAVDSVFLKIPVFGGILGKSSVARFTRTLGTLLTAGVPILEAINITRETSGNAVYARALRGVHDDIREGESFAGPLRAAKVCDNIVVNMIDVGEETGDLDKMLMKIADNYDEEVETLVDSLVSLLEPVMVIVLGGIVGFIVLALFLPLVSLIEAVSGGG